MPPPQNARLGILFVIAAMVSISINDMLIKRFSTGYPLHQMVFLRSLIGICLTMLVLQFEGGFGLLKTRRPGLHAIRAALLVFGNMTFFAALAVLPLATTTALFFISPLVITLLSVVFLGERVGPRRIGAVIAGFLGVLIMMRPGVPLGEDAPARWVYTLPLVAAVAYAGMNVLTRKLGGESSAAALAIYIQAAFLVVGGLFFVVAGDGSLLADDAHPSMVFLLRPWIWPPAQDWPLIFLLGLMSASIGLFLSQAYRLSEANVIAPFEYTALPLSIFWGWLLWSDWPDLWVWSGIGLIVGAGFYVYLREMQGSRKPV